MTDPLAFRIVIPARFASSRLPGKPLRTIAGKPMIRWVWGNAVASGAEQVVVATDDTRIAREVERFGGNVLMTSEQHSSGTERLAEVAERLGWTADDVVVNLQGDEPFIGVELLQKVASALEQHSDVGVATLATPITTSQDLFDPNIVKVVTDARGVACYFSRAPIPWVRDSFTRDLAQLPDLPPQVTFLRHLGLYAYRVGTLRRLAGTEACVMEQAEALEQLRALYLGIQIHVSVIADAPGHGVDTEEDLQRVESFMASSLV